jgi:hypothetical protein
MCGLLQFAESAQLQTLWLELSPSPVAHYTFGSWEHCAATSLGHQLLVPVPGLIEKEPC